MIAERDVLLGVEHLEQRRRRIAAEVGADLVDLVEHEDRVAGARLVHALEDAPGQRADVGAAVAADLGLVVHAAEREAHELASQRARDRAPERGLADARRADEAEQRAARVAFELAHRQVLEDALLDRAQVVVILVEHLPRVVQVEVVLAAQAPRQGGEPVEVGADHRALGAVGMRALEPAHLALELLVGLLRQVALGGLGAVAGDLVGEVVALAQLGVDRAQLLAQEVLALRAVHLLARLGRELLLHLEQVDLALEQLRDAPQPHQSVGGLEQAPARPRA